MNWSILWGSINQKILVEIHEDLSSCTRANGPQWSLDRERILEKSECDLDYNLGILF